MLKGMHRSCAFIFLGSSTAGIESAKKKKKRKLQFMGNNFHVYCKTIRDYSQNLCALILRISQTPVNICRNRSEIVAGPTSNARHLLNI